MKVSQLLKLEHKILGSVTVESFARDCKVCIVAGIDENGNEKLRPALPRRKKQTLAQLKRELLGQKRENLQNMRQQQDLRETFGLDTKNYRGTFSSRNTHEGYAERNMEAFARMIGLEIDE